MVTDGLENYLKILDVWEDKEILLPEIADMAIRTHCIDGILLVSHMHLKAEMK